VAAFPPESRPDSSGIRTEQTLHPYFDEIDDDTWLFASVVESYPPVVLFSANPPLAWPDLTRERVKNHFRTFQLGVLYSVNAAEELAGLRFSLMLIAEREGENGVRRHLTEQTQSREAVTKNSWQGAMYRALMQSGWFCSVGHELIPSP